MISLLHRMKQPDVLDLHVSDLTSASDHVTEFFSSFFPAVDSFRDVEQRESAM